MCVVLGFVLVGRELVGSVVSVVVWFGQSWFGLVWLVVGEVVECGLLGGCVEWSVGWVPRVEGWETTNGFTRQSESRDAGMVHLYAFTNILLHGIMVIES